MEILRSFRGLPACRRLLFPLLHACNKGNRRRLHAGNFAGKLLVARNFDCLNLFLTVTCNSSFLESKQGECFVWIQSSARNCSQQNSVVFSISFPLGLEFIGKKLQLQSKFGTGIRLALPYKTKGIFDDSVCFAPASVCWKKKKNKNDRKCASFSGLPVK